MRAEHIKEILDDLGGGRYRRAGTHIMSVCPMSPWDHKSGREKMPSFGVLLSDGSPTPCHCFNSGCSATGTLHGLIEKVGLKFMGEAREGWDAKRINELQLYMLEMEEEELDDEDRIELPRLPIEESLMAGLGTGSGYWRERGVDEKTMREWKLFEQGGRAIMPIMDRYGDVVGMQGRLLPDFEEDDFQFDIEAGRVPQANKYRTWPPRFEREKYVAGEHLAPGTETVDFLIVGESPADAILLNAWMKEWWSDGRFDLFPYGEDTQGFLAVATMGADWSAKQVQKVLNMLSARGEIALGFDRDKGGIAATLKWSRQHWRQFSRMSLVQWKGNDPSDRGEEEAPIALVQEWAAEALLARKSWLERQLEKKLGRHLTRRA